MTIVFYDLATCSGETISPNPWKTKLSLVLKGLSFESKPVHLHEVQKVLPAEGIPPSTKKPNGSPLFSIPAIHDLATGVKLSDSWEIALYLDKTYPDTQRLFPEGTVALQRAFYDSFGKHFDGAFRFFITRVIDIHTPESRPYLVEYIQRSTGKAFDEVIPQGEEAVTEWGKYKAGIDRLEEWYAASRGLFSTGDKPVFVDLAVVSFFLVQRRTFGEDSAEWKDISSWNGGRWASLVAYFDKLNIAL